MAAASEPPAAMLGCYTLTGPLQRPLGSPFYTSEENIVVKPYEAKKPQASMQEQVEKCGGGLAQSAQRTPYMRGKKEAVTVQYGASSFATFYALVAGLYEKGSGERKFPNLYELSSEGGTDVSALVVDVDGNVEANQCILDKYECDPFLPATPLLDECLEKHPCEALAPHVSEDTGGIPPTPAAQAILFTVVEAVLSVLHAHLSVCPHFTKFEFSPQLFSSCTKSKISFHAVIRIYVYDKNSEKHELVFSSVAAFKQLYQEIAGVFGRAPTSLADHPFLQTPASDPQARAQQLLSIAWLFKPSKITASGEAVEVVENACDMSIASRNRLIRAPYCAKHASVPKLPLCFCSDGHAHVCAFPHLPFDNIADLYTEDSEVCGPYTGGRFFMRGSILYTPPGMPLYVLSAPTVARIPRLSSGTALKTSRKSRAARFEVENDFVPFDPTVDFEQLCKDTVARSDAPIANFKLFSGGRSVHAYCRSANQAPCPIAGRIHHSNNFWYELALAGGKWTTVLHCHAQACKQTHPGGVALPALTFELRDYVQYSAPLSAQPASCDVNAWINVKMGSEEDSEAERSAADASSASQSVMPSFERTSVSGERANVQNNMDSLIAWLSSSAGAASFGV